MAVNRAAPTHGLTPQGQDGVIRDPQQLALVGTGGPDFLRSLFCGFQSPEQRVGDAQRDLARTLDPTGQLQFGSREFNQALRQRLGQLNIPFESIAQRDRRGRPTAQVDYEKLRAEIMKRVPGAQNPDDSQRFSNMSLAQLFQQLPPPDQIARGGRPTAPQFVHNPTLPHLPT